MTAVHTWMVVAPRRMYSATSFHVSIPPMPLIGRPSVSGSAAIDATMLSAIGLTAGPQYPPWLDLLPTTGRGTRLSRSTPVIELIVLMRLTASAPPSFAALAASLMSVMFGVSFTKTGMVADAFAHPVMSQVYSGTCPTAVSYTHVTLPTILR